MGIDSFIIEHKYNIEDYNGDGFSDIRFFVAEKNCISLEISYRDFFYYTKENSIELSEKPAFVNDVTPNSYFKPIFVIKNKNGKYYELREYYSLKHGMSYFKYDFGLEDNYNQDYKTVYEGQSYGEDQSCPADKGILLDKAILKRTFTKKDINNDNIEDLVIDIEEQDCKTNAITLIKKKILSSGNKFNIITVRN